MQPAELRHKRDRERERHGGERSSEISFNEFMDTFRGEVDMLMSVSILSTAR